MTTYRVTLQQARDEFQRLRQSRVPLAMRRAMYQYILAVKRNVDTHLSARKSFQASQLRGYAAAQDPYEYGNTMSWGLPTGELEARIGAFRERGGTIVPKRAKMLRIPLAAAKTSAGQDRFDGERLRTHPGFFVAKKSDGRLFLMRAQSRKPAVVEAWYRLMYSVKIGPHPWLRPSVEIADAQLPGIIDHIMQEETK